MYIQDGKENDNLVDYFVVLYCKKNYRNIIVKRDYLYFEMATFEKADVCWGVILKYRTEIA